MVESFREGNESLDERDRIELKTALEENRDWGGVERPNELEDDQYTGHLIHREFTYRDSIEWVDMKRSREGEFNVSKGREKFWHAVYKMSTEDISLRQARDQVYEEKGSYNKKKITVLEELTDKEYRIPRHMWGGFVQLVHDLGYEF